MKAGKRGASLQSEANIWNFRQFYLTHPSEEILYTLRRELSWSHYRLIEEDFRRLMFAAEEV